MSKDRAIIASLLLALVLELAALLWHSGFFHLRDTSSIGRPAGHIVKIQNQLRRRSADSLVWEDSGSEETVYYHDSILTLKESQGLLHLDNDTEVSLSENTLITIEPVDADRGGEIRLRFVRGNLGARNPFHNAKIEGEAWSVDLKKGSDLEMRELAGGQVEVQLKSGDAEVRTASGSVSPLTGEKIVRLSGKDAQSWTIDRTLSWTAPPPKRIYVHGDSVPVTLDWKGESASVLLQSLGKGERDLPVQAGTHRLVTELPLGSHRIYLRDGERTSEPLDIQVWRAPTIHLLSPLPRNRVENRKSIAFLWQQAPDVKGYNLNIVGGQSPRRLQSPINRTELTFTQEEDLQWFVEGVDADGFTIPPAYRYPLYPRDNPFAAPKLRSPHLRAPASKKAPGKGAWIWSLIMPSAQAEDLFEAEFAWDAVPEANQYVIEISESADFRDPIVNKTLKGKTQFLWRGFKLQKYYWRVAAGHSRGRMGVFSEPETVDFSPLKNGDFAAVDGILIRKLKTDVEEKSPAPVIEPAAEKSAETPPPEPAGKGIEIPFTADRILLWQPKYSLMTVVGSEDSEAKLNGASWMSLGIEWPWMDREGALWIFDLALTSYEFQPDPKSKYPFQPDLTWIEADAHLVRFFSAVGLGFDVRRKLSLERTDYEAVRASTALWFGADLEKRYVLPRGQLAIRLSPLFSRDGQALSIASEWRARIGSRFVTGVGLDSIFFLSAPDTGYEFDAYFTIGFPF